MKAPIIPVTPLQQTCSVIWDERSKHAAVVDRGKDLDRVLAEVDR